MRGERKCAKQGRRYVGYDKKEKEKKEREREKKKEEEGKKNLTTRRVMG